MNALKTFATKIIGTAIATGLIAGAAFAATASSVNVTLPEPVSIGGATLASGHYTITESFNAGNVSMLVFRDDKGDATTAIAKKIADRADDDKTEVILSQNGGTLHLDKMFIQGDAVGYQFDGAK